MTTTLVAAPEPDDPKHLAESIVSRHLGTVPDLSVFAPAAPDGDQGEADPFASLARGGSWVLDIPDTAAAVWGEGDDVLWSSGEALMICGQQGVGKTTLAHQLIRARLGLDTQVLGFPVAPADRRVLYLAMDRPAQAARAMRRIVKPAERELLDDRFRVWPGPPPFDVAKTPDVLVRLAEAAGADTIVVDSLKDAAVKLVDDEVGGSYNRARQKCLVEGVEVLELHHQRKTSANGGRPDSIGDIYGSVWLTSGCGSILMLNAEPGDMVIEARHVKQPASDVGPLRIVHDHDHGRSRLADAVDLIALAERLDGLTAADAACALFESAAPTRNETEKARRRLDRLAEAGQLTRSGGGRGRGNTATYTVAPAPRDWRKGIA